MESISSSLFVSLYVTAWGFCHANQSTGPIFSHSALSPHFEDYLIRTNSQTKQVVIIPVHADVVELKRSVGAERSCFNFEPQLSDPEVRAGCTSSIAGLDCQDG